MKPIHCIVLGLLIAGALEAQQPTEKQLANWLKRFPAADANKDGKLNLEEARAFQKQRQAQQRRQGGAPHNFKVDPGWAKAPAFPKHALMYKSAAELKELASIRSFPKTKGVLRVVGTGHSFMMPGYRTLPAICKAAGFEQPLHLHTGGGITGSTRYKWEQENGIFQFDKRPRPVLLPSIANAKWEAMMWGPYFNDQPAYYLCWMDFCLKYNPGMKFYLSDAWPQLYQLGPNPPKNEKALTAQVWQRLGKQKNVQSKQLVDLLNKKHPGTVFIMPTSDAMVLAAEYFLRGELPGVQGLHKSVGGKDRSLWRDRLGHLGPGFDRLEGYVFYATLYGRSPELIEGDIAFGGDKEFPSRALDRTFRKIAWQAVINHPFSGVKDKDGNGVGD